MNATMKRSPRRFATVLLLLAGLGVAACGSSSSGSSTSAAPTSAGSSMRQELRRQRIPHRRPPARARAVFRKGPTPVMLTQTTTVALPMGMGISDVRRRGLAAGTRHAVSGMLPGALALALTGAGCGTSSQAPFGWVQAQPAPRHWAVVRIASGSELAYPPGWRIVPGDRGTATAALLDKGGRYLGYLNVTPSPGRRERRDVGVVPDRPQRRRGRHRRQAHRGSDRSALPRRARQLLADTLP